MFFFQVVFKLKSDGEAELIEMSTVLDHLKLTQATFLSMCIASGCDLLENVKGIRVKRAKEIVSQAGYEERLSTLANAHPNYLENFTRAKRVFQHQTVFNVGENCLTPLNPWGLEAPSIEDLEACGQYPFLSYYFPFQS